MPQFKWPSNLTKKPYMGPEPFCYRTRTPLLGPEPLCWDQNPFARTRTPLLGPEVLIRVSQGGLHNLIGPRSIQCRILAILYLSWFTPHTSKKGVAHVQNLDCGLWTGPWTGPWTGLFSVTVSWFTAWLERDLRRC